MSVLCGPERSAGKVIGLNVLCLIANKLLLIRVELKILISRFIIDSHFDEPISLSEPMSFSLCCFQLVNERIFVLSCIEYKNKVSVFKIDQFYNIIQTKNNILC